MQFSIEQLEAFIVSVEQGSFSAAARKLNKAQSSISGLISNLEVDVGFLLFDRTTRSPKLTDKGLAIYNDIRSVTNSHKNLSTRITHIAADIESELIIAYDELAFPKYELLKILDKFNQKFASTSLLLVAASHKSAFKLVEQGKANLAVSLSVDDYPEQVTFRGIGHAHYYTVVAPSHPLAQLNKVSTDDLALQRHIRITDTESGFRRFDSGLSNQSWYVNDVSMLLEIVESGFGWAQLPAHAVKNAVKDGDLVILQTDHQTVTFPHCIDLVWQHKNTTGPALNWLLNAFTNAGQRTVL
ncbi:LysR family transcriptional regulator [Pseudoalteromonas sp. PA2MD11]|uniref:LysR family transcriptional regulator n=1 Tax=Pseudoalteromonas sp. PA2MD11 TaxID=2785057 RepID=UPI001ADEFA5B|nr:LysR family transcriptional regulator [Pseudoalteromonas sp. PA2MD11]